VDLTARPGKSVEFGNDISGISDMLAGNFRSSSITFGNFYAVNKNLRSALIDFLHVLLDSSQIVLLSAELFSMSGLSATCHISQPSEVEPFDSKRTPSIRLNHRRSSHSTQSVLRESQ